MTGNLKKVCYSLLRELNNGRDVTDIFYIAYAASLPVGEAVKVMDEIIFLGGAERLDIKRYKLYDINAVLAECDTDEPVEEDNSAEDADDPWKAIEKSIDRRREIIRTAEARRKRMEQSRLEIEEALKKFDGRKGKGKRAKPANLIKPRACRVEEKRAAATLIGAIERIKEARRARALSYPSGKLAEDFINGARNALVWDKTGGYVRIYLEGLKYPSGEQVQFRLINRNGISFLGDDRFLFRKIMREKGIDAAEAEKEIIRLTCLTHYSFELFELRVPVSKQSALEDVIEFYNFILNAFDGI